MNQIALDKRMNEIRRLEGIKDDLLLALKVLTVHFESSPRPGSLGANLIDNARNAIVAAEKSHPA